MCYEGLLDEYFNIDSGRIKIPKSDATDSTAKQFETVSMSTRDDTLMEGVRATHFTKIFQVIKGNDEIDREKKATTKLFLQIVWPKKTFLKTNFEVKCKTHRSAFSKN